MCYWKTFKFDVERFLERQSAFQPKYDCFEHFELSVKTGKRKFYIVILSLFDISRKVSFATSEMEHGY